MTRLLLLALVLAACDEKAPPPPEDDDERAAVAVDEPPGVNLGALPISLPQIDAGHVRPIPRVGTFLVLASGGDVSVGALVNGRPTGGTVIEVGKIAETLAMLIGDHVDAGGGAVTLRAVESPPAVDTLALIDENATADKIVPVLQQVAQRPVAIAVATQGRRGRLAFVTGPGILRGAPVHFEVTTSGVSIYGSPYAWGDVGGGVKELLDTHKRSSSMSVLAELAIAPAVPAQRLIGLLGLLSASGVSEAQLAVDAALEPVRPPGVYVSREGGIPRVAIGQPNAVGDLDKAIIRRYIKRNIQKITYCYEKALLAKPALQGTIVVQFFIAPTGRVAQAQASGVDPEVSRCVADVVKSIEFPKPKGGGGVQVNYPFTFRPDGG